MTVQTGPDRGIVLRSGPKIRDRTAYKSVQSGQSTATARDPLAVCRFDKPKSEKCARCHEQKSPCDLVGILPFISVFLLLTPSDPARLGLSGHRHSPESSPP